MKYGKFMCPDGNELGTAGSAFIDSYEFDPRFRRHG